MRKLLKKDFRAFMGPKVRAVHNSVNAYCVGQPLVLAPGHVASHYSGEPKAGKIEWEGFEVTITSTRRPRVVCNVPTPFSLYTFTYCLKHDGKPIAWGETLAGFSDAVFFALRRLGLERIAA